MHDVFLARPVTPVDAVVDKLGMGIAATQVLETDFVYVDGDKLFGIVAVHAETVVGHIAEVGRTVDAVLNSDINKHSKSKEVYLPAVHRYANIAHILGLNNYNPVMTVRSLVNWIQFMQKEMNIPLTIQEIGTVTPDEYFGAIDKMADAALADACTSTNPRVPTKEDIMKIYKKLWSF